jgi:class 3 adenylate cyclase
MKCPKCQTENPEDSKFCRKCGSSTESEISCPNCGSTHPADSNFCNKCGLDLKAPKESSTTADSKPTSPTPTPPVDKPLPVPTKFDGERKYVTVLFSDMSGYTAMSEKLDPEEVKEITSRIFGEISQIVIKYDGFIEKFIGDAIMAVFGATKAFEDDPIRAIKATREIHRLVKSLSPEYEERIGQPLSMHTGINTGLVVTGEVDLEKGTHGIAGDTINLAARLSGLGKEGDILVGPDTHAQAEGYFDFETLEPAKVKGKAKAIRVYRVLAKKEKPRKVHRLQGVRAKLIGRKVEMDQLAEAVGNLQKGNGSTFAVCGTAGTGKSRLVEEFKSTLDLEEIQWLEGHAYPYAQNIPYFPLINLLSRAFQIEEGDAPERIREKVESSIAFLVGETEDVVPYVGSLYSLSYPEIENMSPEFWKSKIQIAIQSILSALAQRGPTVICLEDLHWADPSFLELIRLILSDSRDPILFLCMYRPAITLFTGHRIQQMVNPYKEIRLQDLSASESQDMVESLLNTEDVPPELRQFVQEKVEGNPFYLEEAANSLIESETLVHDDGQWRMTRPITETDISSTIHGLISARLDRLKNETKRVLQEASVIGRAFLFEILKRVTDPEQDIDQSMRGLEQLDLIRAKTLQDINFYLSGRTEGPIFPSKKKGKKEPICLVQINRIVSDIGKRAKIENPNPNSKTKHVTPHLLRHSFARMAKDAGLTVESVQKLLRHASFKTTMDLYGTMSFEDVQENYEDKFLQMI